jgi:hypothetical protein
MDAGNGAGRSRPKRTRRRSSLGGDPLPGRDQGTQSTRSAKRIGLEGPAPATRPLPPSTRWRGRGRQQAQRAWVRESLSQSPLVGGADRAGVERPSSRRAQVAGGAGGRQERDRYRPTPASRGRPPLSARSATARRWRAQAKPRARRRSSYARCATAGKAPARARLLRDVATPSTRLGSLSSERPTPPGQDAGAADEFTRAAERVSDDIRGKRASVAARSSSRGGRLGAQAPTQHRRAGRRARGAQFLVGGCAEQGSTR